ncbi:hypothetical protein DFQ29_007963 [Apophysomyces sp. BC1021]|nr:hypothetical protein DFQ29_007963 [Apophysomyces sp. BC1021]
MIELSQALDIDSRGLFLTCIIFFGFLFAAVTVVCIVLWVMWELLALSNPYRFGGQRSKIGNVNFGAFLRLMTLFCVPLTSLSFYQLMLPSPWYLIMMAALVLVVGIFGLYGHTSLHLICSQPRDMVLSNIQLLLRYGSLYGSLRSSALYFFVVILLSKAFIGSMVGLFQMNGEAQVIAILVIESTLFLALCIKSPYLDRAMNFLETVVAGIRTTVCILNLLHTHATNLTDHQRQYVAYTQICMHFFVFVLFLGIHVARLLLLLEDSCCSYRNHDPENLSSKSSATRSTMDSTLTNAQQ